MPWLALGVLVLLAVTVLACGGLVVLALRKLQVI